MEIPKKKELFELEHICPSTKRKFHQDAGPPNWKCLCINFQPGGPESQCIYSIPKKLAYDQTDRHNSQKACRQPDERIHGHIILPLRGFKPVDWSRMCCAKLRAAQIKFYCRFKAIFQTKIPIYNIYIYKYLFILQSFIKK